MPCWKNQPWQRDSNETASGKPGAVHSAPPAGQLGLNGRLGLTLLLDHQVQAVHKDAELEVELERARAMQTLLFVALILSAAPAWGQESIEGGDAAIEGVVDLGPLEGVGFVCNRQPDTPKDVEFDHRGWVTVGGDDINYVVFFREQGMERVFTVVRIDSNRVDRVSAGEAFILVSMAGGYDYRINRTTLEWITYLNEGTKLFYYCESREIDQLEDELERARVAFRSGRRLD